MYNIHSHEYYISTSFSHRLILEMAAISFSQRQYPFTIQNQIKYLIKIFIALPSSSKYQNTLKKYKISIRMFII